MRKKLVLAALLLGTATVGAEAAQSIEVEQYQARTAGTVASYAVKFVCGTLPTATHPGFVPGSYQTAINIHNPNPTAVKFREKAVIATPQDQPRGLIAKFVSETLEPDQAL